jgi:outer membrane biosynthesis protein TonB
MTMSPRALIILSMSVLLLGPINSALSDTHDKESSTEAPAPRPQRPPTASDGQPAPTKPPTDVKPQSSPAPTTKTDTPTDHKEVAPEKHAPTKPPTEGKAQSAPAPATKTDSQPAESESKEKDQTAKRPLGSLILSVKLAQKGDPRLIRYEI